jgi:hypothetical protein
VTGCALPIIEEGKEGAACDSRSFILALEYPLAFQGWPAMHPRPGRKKNTVSTPRFCVSTVSAGAKPTVLRSESVRPALTVLTVLTVLAGRNLLARSF